MIGLPIIGRLRTLAFAALALAVFGASEWPPQKPVFHKLNAQHTHTPSHANTLTLSMMRDYKKARESQDHYGKSAQHEAGLEKRF